MEQKAPSLRLDPKIRKSIEAIQEPGEDDLFKTLVDVFFEDSVEHSKALKSWKPGDEFTKIKKTVHLWASSSGAIGAMKFSEMCREVEHCQDQAKLPTLIAALLQELEDTTQELNSSGL